MKHLLKGLFIFGGNAAGVLAAEVAPDKSSYHLFKPVPRELMREMSTDRPDKTESPYTVDAGHFQVEADVVNYSYDAHNVTRDHTITESLAIAPFNFKVGLRHNWDVQFVVPTYNAVRIRERQTGLRNTERGFGDFILRSKINLWGNDDGDTAFALMPFVKFPTASRHLGNGAFEGGIIAPLGIALPANWSMTMMTELDFNEDADGNGHHPEWINSITFSHDIVGDLAGYTEFFSSVSSDEDAKWIGTVDLGLTYGLTEDIQLDAGINIGVTRAADDWNPFVGISWRF
ncbi:MAG TPA: transporter [Candidatus Limnocylindria bacterium]|nr:transporter [Candidatus Limnocylindria bacterium]